MRKQLSYLLLVFLIAITSSCSLNWLSKNKVEYVPFQETKDGLWGMISLDGKTLFKEEFKSEPTIVRDGRFFVKNDEDLWEMYEASEKPKKIGGEYVYISGFKNGYALVTERNKPISLINTDGKVVKELDKIANKKVLQISAFDEDGYAIFATADSLYGAINTSGDCVIQPQYLYLDHRNKIFLGIKSKYKEQIQNNEFEKIKLSIMDEDGKDILEISGAKFGHIIFGDDKYATSVKKGDEERWIIYNMKGEILYQCSSKVERITELQGDNFIYSNGTEYGLMNINGESLIRAKYSYLRFDGERLNAENLKNGKLEYKIIDTSDQQIGSDTYDVITSFFDGEHRLVKIAENDYGIIDQNGVLLKNLPDMVNIGYADGDPWVKTDYVDIDAILTQLDFKTSGIDGFTFQTSAKSAVERILTITDQYKHNIEEHPDNDPYWYDTTSSLNYQRNIEGITANIAIDFDDYLSQENLRTERVPENYWGETYSYNKRKSAGYTWNPVKPSFLGLFISNEGKMRGKLSLLFDRIVAHLIQGGTVAKENDAAKVFNLKNGLRALVALESNQVFIVWGNIKPVSEIDIDQYKGNKEDYLSSGDVKYNDYGSSMTADSLDSVMMADSLAAIDATGYYN